MVRWWIYRHAVPKASTRCGIITDRDKEGMEVLRHTAAHVLAQAMRRLYGDGVQYTIGPALTDDFQYGFYYDFDLPEPDLAGGPAEDRGRDGQDRRGRYCPSSGANCRSTRPRPSWSSRGQNYKVEMIDDLVAPSGVQSVSLYEQGDFLDMCRGPHLPSHRPDQGVQAPDRRRGVLARQREEQDAHPHLRHRLLRPEGPRRAHLTRIEEAKKRDHRIIGKQIGAVPPRRRRSARACCCGCPRARSSAASWRAGCAANCSARGYQVVFTPHIGKLELYNTTGHFPYYKDSQFPPIEMTRGAKATCSSR